MLLVLCCSLLVLVPIQAKVACQSDRDCETILRPGSHCTTDGFCDNPYQYGCFYARQNDTDQDNLTDNHEFPTHRRVCHSEDPPNAAALGLCRAPNPALRYPEVRILSQNWESPFLEAWLLQILLSEVLQVPTTLETGIADKQVNFYDPQLRVDYGVAYDMPALERAAQVGDCTQVHTLRNNTTNDNDNNSHDEYLSCGHAIMEIWSGQEEIIVDLVARQKAEPKSFIGVVGQEGWVLSKYTARNDSSLLSHLGYRGDENRHKLADLFGRPTKWSDYCTQVAGYQDGNLDCVDDTSERLPRTEEEGGRYFVPGLYRGHFRKTEENNCEKWPDNCTGHFMDYPCGWSSFFIQQVHHLNIGLKSSGDEPYSGGYPYDRMVEIFHAANATKSDLVGWWWRPEALYLQFQNTDFELQHVSFPPTNHVCVQQRASIAGRCSPNPSEQVGSASGVCDVPPIPNYKLMSTGLYDLVYDPDIPEGQRSPGYDVVKEFIMDGFQLGEIFDYWNSRDSDKYGFDPRDAVCRWAHENFDYLQRFIPRSYPRVIETKGETALNQIAIAFGCLAVVMTFLAMVVTYRQRQRRVFQYAQVEFVFLLLLGMMLVSTGAVVSAIHPPSSGRCVASVWLVNVGYSFELVPLVVKIAAINRLMNAARNLKRIKLSRRFLFGVVALLTAVVALYMALWTALDAPHKAAEYTLTDRQSIGGETIVTQVFFCESGSDIWMLISVGSQGFLLLCASILAFLTRKVPKDINEANTISFLIYWNFVCVLLRTILLMLTDSIGASKVNQTSSLIMSADSIATVVIYFIPKFLSQDAALRGRWLHANSFVNVGLPEIISSAEEKEYSSVNHSLVGRPSSFLGARGSSRSLVLGAGSDLSVVLETDDSGQPCRSKTDMGHRDKAARPSTAVAGPPHKQKPLDPTSPSEELPGDEVTILFSPTVTTETLSSQQHPNSAAQEFSSCEQDPNLATSTNSDVVVTNGQASSSSPPAETTNTVHET
eukprot:CAMPEP_0172451532 /NCGR_PEP_ID=MMETSP1065-20121228/9543_1 /TAXON_ID=265537 /ORGANISM="Amphiprora paludosa, Strain CCMP125" /LENGTH=993 /DNA_ID=CAMNT_0013203495 /DNA_START=474 /DNA_END=3455 /DNA_ORIENTATION=-